MCSKVLNGHIILTDTSITTILAPEMTYTPNYITSVAQRLLSNAKNRMIMSENTTVEQRLDRIERLLRGQKTVLNFAEACEFTGLSKTYMYLSLIHI